MKTAILAIMSAGLLLAGKPTVAQSSLPVPPAPVGGGLSTAPVGHCQEISVGDANMSLLSSLCESTQTYIQKLPDFLCQETTTEKRDPFDVVLNAQVTFLRGDENYSHVTINGRTVDDKDSAVTSLMAFNSDGEFGLFLANLFKSPIVAKFKFAKNSKLDGSRVTVYDFDVPAAKSFWRMRDRTGHVLTPGFQGQLWLERTTGRLLKIELQPVDLPANFELTSIHTTIDYAPTSLGDAGVFVLPVRSETTVCERWKNSQCPKHVMTFHDCQKFAATTRIVAEGPEP